jgi:peptide/nickel transport system permease protein
MGRFVLVRASHALLVVLGVSVVAFALLHLSGDPAAILLPPSATREDIELYRHQLGLDRPLPVQYIDFLSKAVRGDFGISYRHNQPALGLVLERVPATLELSGSALLLALVVSVPLGILAAIKRGSVFDQASLVLSVVGQAFPVFWLGIVLIIVFAENLRWLPASGRGSPQNLVMPALVLSAYSMAVIARILRSSLLDVLNADFVRTAHAKGLSGRAVLLGHALKNAALPVVTVGGLQIGTLLGGAVITEEVFAYPGMGRLAVQAISNRDFSVVQVFVMVMAVLIVAINFLTDLLYAWLDPRVQVEH